MRESEKSVKKVVWFQIAGAVALYWFVSISLVFVNKNLLSGYQGFDAPIFVAWFQCVVTVAMCYASYTMSLVFPSAIDFPKPIFTFSTGIQVILFVQQSYRIRGILTFKHTYNFTICVNEV